MQSVNCLNGHFQCMLFAESWITDIAVTCGISQSEVGYAKFLMKATFQLVRSIGKQMYIWVALLVLKLLHGSLEENYCNE